MLYYLNCMSSTSSYLKYLLSEKELEKERSFLNMSHISTSVSSLLILFSLPKASYPKLTFIIHILNVLYCLVHVLRLHEAFPLTPPPPKKRLGSGSLLRWFNSALFYRCLSSSLYTMNATQ